MIGFIVLATFLVALPLIHNRGLVKKNKPRSLLDLGALKEVPFVLFFISGFVAYLGYFSPYFYAPTFAQLDLHSSQDAAVYLIAIANAGQFFGRITPGLVPTTIRPIYVNLGCAFVGGVLNLAWIGIHNVPGFIVYNVLYGYFTGLYITVAVAVVPSLCPDMTKIGARMGM